MGIHIREHETGGRRFRIWIDDMANFGQFNIASYEDVQTLHSMLGKLNLGQIRFHDCYDGPGDCECQLMTYGTELRDFL